MKINLEIETPNLPNFLRINRGCQYFKTFGEDACVDVADLTDEQLIEVADQWKEQLLEHAADRRIHKLEGGEHVR